MPCSIGHNDTPGQRFGTLVISRVALTFHGAEVTSTKPQMIVMLAISKRQRKTAEGDGWERMIRMAENRQYQVSAASCYRNNEAAAFNQ
jgi:hypothetical protein